MSYKVLKRLVLSLVIVSFLTLSVSAAPVIIKFCHGDVAEESYYSWESSVRTFKRLVETRSGGDITVEIYPNCQLGGEREQFEQVMMGTAQMTSVSISPLSAWIPEVMVLDIPYAFTESWKLFEILDGWFGQELSDLVLEETGLRILGFANGGFRSFYNNVKPFHSPDDLKGMKIRTRENEAEMEMTRATGASVTPISWSEIYTSLQQGVVDGGQNAIADILNANIYEVQKYLTLSNHSTNISPISINEKFYQSLSPEHKKIIADSAREAIMAYRGFIEYGAAIGLEKLEAEGMEIYSPTSEEMDQFKNVMQKPIEDFVENKIGREWIEKLYQAIDEVDENYNKTLGL